MYIIHYSIPMSIEDLLELPLRRDWVVWVDSPACPLTAAKLPHHIGSFDTVRTMWEWKLTLPENPTSFIPNSNVYIFQDGISPVWEDPANVGGGRWMFSILREHDKFAPIAWQNVFLSVVGETLITESESEESIITGIILARRSNYTRISIWTRAPHTEKTLQLGQMLKSALPTFCIEFQVHGAAFGSYLYQL